MPPMLPLPSGRPGSGAGNLNFEAGLHRVLGIGGAQKTAAVGPLRDLELEVDDEVAVLTLGPEIVVVVLLAIGAILKRDHAIFDRPVGGGMPAGEVAAVEEGNEALRRDRAPLRLGASQLILPG